MNSLHLSLIFLPWIHSIEYNSVEDSESKFTGAHFRFSPSYSPTHVWFYQEVNSGKTVVMEIIVVSECQENRNKHIALKAARTVASSTECAPLPDTLMRLAKMRLKLWREKKRIEYRRQVKTVSGPSQDKSLRRQVKTVSGPSQDKSLRRQVKTVSGPSQDKSLRRQTKAVTGESQDTTLRHGRRKAKTCTSYPDLRPPCFSGYSSFHYRRRAVIRFQKCYKIRQEGSTWCERVTHDNIDMATIKKNDYELTVWFPVHLIQTRGILIKGRSLTDNTVLEVRLQSAFHSNGKSLTVYYGKHLDIRNRTFPLDVNYQLRMNREFSINICLSSISIKVKLPYQAPLTVPMQHQDHRMVENINAVIVTGAVSLSSLSLNMNT